MANDASFKLTAERQLPHVRKATNTHAHTALTPGEGGTPGATEVRGLGLRLAGKGLRGSEV